MSASTVGTLAEVRTLRPTGLLEEDIKFRQKLFSVIASAAIGDDGILTELPLLKAMLLRPAETEVFASRLARLFHTKEVTLVIGIDDHGAVLAHSVARILEGLYSSDRPVSFLSMKENHDGTYAFSLHAPEVLRGANAILIEPFLAPGRWPRIQTCLKSIEALSLNANVSAIGTVIEFDGRPAGTKNGFRVESLLSMEFSAT